MLSYYSSKKNKTKQTNKKNLKYQFPWPSLLKRLNYGHLTLCIDPNIDSETVQKEDTNPFLQGWCSGGSKSGI